MCPSLKEIFEIDCINVVPPRKELLLYGQNMKSMGNKDPPQGYLAFKI